MLVNGRSRILASLAAGVAMLLLGSAAALRPAAGDEQIAPAVRPAAGGGQVAPATLAPFVTLTGSSSHVADRRCLRITTPEAWSALWLEHLGEPPKTKYGTYYNKSGLPVVDFDRCMIIAVFGGATQNTAGYHAVPVLAAPTGAGAGTADGSGAGAAAEASAGVATMQIVAHSYQTIGTVAGDPNAPGAWADGGDKVTPFAFFIVPRTLGPLVVEDLQVPMGGGTARATERARVPALPDALPASTPEPPEGR